MPAEPRSDGRSLDQLRPVSLSLDIAPNASGSVLVSFGNTRVICAAMLERRVPRWMNEQKVPGGWMTAEYSMLPYSTEGRKQREVSRGKQEGRSIEIQRLIGRSLRAVADLKKLPGYTLWLDCDVLQADGGTRTASITGAYVAAQLAIEEAIERGDLKESPFREAVAAISVGVVEGEPMLDLCYTEDFAAAVDANVVMTASGEEAVFTPDELQALLGLADKGIRELIHKQQATLAEAAQKRSAAAREQLSEAGLQGLSG